MVDSSDFSYAYLEDISLPPFFYDAETDNPLIHIRKFEKWCSSCFVVERCVDSDYFRYFTSFLRDVALCWFESLSPAFFSTWLVFQT